MSDHEYIWLEPKCCADEYGNGRTWRQDDVWEHHEKWNGEHSAPTKYIRFDLHEIEVERLGKALADERQCKCGRCRSLQAEVERLQKIAACVPAKIYIAAEEAAGYAEIIMPTDTPEAEQCATFVSQVRETGD